MTHTIAESDVSISFQQKKKTKYKRCLSLASFLLNRHQYTDATSQLKQAYALKPNYYTDILILLYKKLIKEPENTHYLVMIANTYLLTHHYSDALQILEDIFEINPYESSIYHLLAQIYPKSPDKQKIKALFESALAKGIFHTSITQTLPSIYIREHQYKKAIYLYQYFIDQKPKHIPFYKTLAELYIKTNQVAKAVHVYESLFAFSQDSAPDLYPHLSKLMSEFPRNKTLRKLLIDLSFLSCQPHKAVHHTKQFMKLHSDHMADILPTLIHSKKNYPQNLEISLLIIEIYSHLKEWLPCLDELQPLLKDLQHVPILLPILSNILSHEPQHYLANLFAGDAWQLQDQIEKTLHHYAQIVDVSKSEEVEIRLKNLHPKYPEHQDYITLLLAKIRFQNADHNAALSLAKSIQNSRESLEVYLLKTAIFSKRNQYETSFTILHEALSQFPDHSLIHQTLFNTFHQCCESQIEKITGTSNLYNNRNKYHEDLGFIYLNHAQLLEAITNFQKIDTPKKTLDQYLLLGRCFLEYNRFDTALEQFQSCIQQSAQEPEIQRLCHYYITLCFFYLGKFSNSTPHIEWIMNQMPQYHEIKSLETFEKKAQEQVSKGRCLFGVFHTLDSKSPSFKCALPTQFKGKKTKQAFLHTLSFSETHNEQGVEYALQNQYKLAEEEFIHAINMDSNCFMAHFNLTFLYLNMGKFEPAKTHRDICQHIDKTHPYLPCLSALLALKEDNWKQAQKALEMIHTDELHFGIGQLLLGDIQYRYLHNIELAKKYWQTAIKHCPHFFPLIQRRYQYQQLPQSQLDAWIQPRSDF